MIVWRYCSLRSARTCARVTPAISTRFVRLLSPETILTADTGTFKRPASTRRRASLARSSTGGAVSRTFSAPLYSPSIASRLARGATRTAKTILPSCSWTSTTTFSHGSHHTICPAVFSLHCAGARPNQAIKLASQATHTAFLVSLMAELAAICRRGDPRVPPHDSPSPKTRLCRSGHWLVDPYRSHFGNRSFLWPELAHC